MIKIPAHYSYIEAYLTFRCNLKCSYCINAHSGIKRARKEMTAREWIIGLNNIDTGNRPITIGGGEPTTHPGFYDIINNLRPDIKIDLLTNGQFDLKEFVSRCRPERFSNSESGYYKSIRISFHPAYMDKTDLVSRAKYLIERGFNAGIFGLNHPESLIHNVEMTDICSKAGVYFFVRDFLGFYDDRLYGYYKYPNALNGNRKKCLCRAEDFLIGPEGNTYRCHRDLYANEGEIGSIMNISYQVDDKFIPCENYGACNPCDIKMKLKPSLGESKCAVEIRTELLR
jgi:hypothetical protein